jgi:serine/threonine protein kinase
MDPERWRRVEDLFHAALDRAPVVRQALLEVDCGGDIDLRRQVELLLAQHEEAGSFLETPAIPNTAVTGTAGGLLGRQVGPYRIVSWLGAGGMGEVYRAHDSKLGRYVAIKTLAPEFARDPERLARLQREARTLASLNHPHIGAIYGLEESGGMDCLVLELVEGDTLRGPLPVPTALDRGRQVAEALEAAHAKGIIHRDLKPANVKVTPAGTVKVVDFGLAKAIWGPEQNHDLSQAAAITGVSTLAGNIVGTPGYMSPEQASGNEVDERTDVWAFGCLLYELLTGKRAFHGESNEDTLAAVLEREPDLKALPPKTSAPIRELLRQCLQKETGRRLQRISDARRTIEEAQRGSKRWRVAAVAAAGLAMAAIGAALWLRSPARAPDRSLTRIAASAPSAELTQKQLTFNSSENRVVSDQLSPDGKYLAYSDPAGIHVRLLSTGEERLIPRPAGGPAGADWVVNSWFPDGTQLLATTFEVGGQKSIWTVPVLGQPPRQLRENAGGLKVSPDGTHIAFRPLGTSDRGREIWVMGSQGDNPYQVLAVGENEWLTAVHWSPDGHRLAYIRHPHGFDSLQSSIETCDLKGANRVVVVPADRERLLLDFYWFSEGRIVYVWQEQTASDSNLSQVAIDNQAGSPNGKPKSITQWAGSDVGDLSASADGKRLVIRKRTHQTQTYLGELAAGGTRMKPPHRLTNSEATEWPTAWTADSKAVLLASNRNGTYGIYKFGISQGTSAPIITGLQDLPFMRFSSDGAWILFMEFPATSARPGPPQRMVRIPASGGAPRFVLETADLVDFRCAPGPSSRCIVSDLGPGRKQLIITAFDPVEGRGRMLRTIENDPVRPYTSALSPDGSTIAVSHPEESRIQIRLLSLTGGSDCEVEVKGWPFITSIDWSPDGKGFHCVSHSPQGNTFLYVDLKGNAQVLWQSKAGGVDWSIPSPDGRYLAIMVRAENENVWMVEGF